MRHLDLFSGIGGFALAAQWVWGDEHEIVSFVEIDQYCQAILYKHWPDVPIHDDIRTYRHDETDVDLVTGGYPCQAFSKASHGQIVAEDLSSEMLQVVKKVQPQYVIAENVNERTIRHFAKELHDFGYDTNCCRFAANDFGLDHKRVRWFALAYPYNKSELCSKINAEASRMQGLQGCARGYEDYSRVLRVSDGIPNRMDRLRGLGNAIVPQVVVPIMQAIKEIDDEFTDK